MNNLGRTSRERQEMARHWSPWLVYDDSTSSHESDEEDCESESSVSEEEEVEEISDAKRPKQLLDSAFQSWKSGLYTDVTVIIGEKRFVAHRLVLASLSDYFPRLLKFDENSSGEVTLYDIEPDDFDVLLKYAYTGNVDVNEDNVQSLLISADYFNVGHVKQKCVQFMTANFDLDNICDVLNFVFQHTLPLPELMENARQFLKNNFGEFVQSETLTKLEPTFLENFFSDSDLILYSHKVSLKSAARECLILNAVLKYLSTRPESDPANIEMLIRTVRLPLVPEDDLQQCLGNYTSFKSNPIIQKYLQLRETALKVMQKRKQGTSKTNSPEAKEIPETWFQFRKPAVFSFVQRSKRYATLGHGIGPTLEPPEYEYTDCDLEIKKIEIWLRIWNNNITVIGGLVLSHQNPHNAEETLVYRRGSCPGSCDHTVELEPDEYIVHVTIGCGGYVDRLGFKTNRGRVCGPFGGNGGQEYTESCPVSHLSYLYDINCAAVHTQGSEAIFNLTLRWISFS